MLYVLLGVIGLVAAFVAFTRSERKARTAAALAVAAAVVMIADWVAFGWLHLYDYLPGLVAERRVDEILGEFLAEQLFAPGFAVFLIVCLRAPLNALVGALIVTVIEVYFLNEGVFAHTGWRLWFTTAGFLVYFLLLERWWRSLNEVGQIDGWLGKVLRICLLFMSTGLLTLIFRATRLVKTNLHLLPNESANQSLLRFIIYVPVTLLLGYWAVGATGTARWRRLVVTLAALALYNAALVVMKIQIFRPPWSIALDSLAMTVAIATASFAHDWIIALDQRESRERVRI